MSDESKRAKLDALRTKFAEFMQEVIKIDGSAMQKQQAFIKFEEAHMWLQNAIVTYVEPAERPLTPPQSDIQPK